MTFLENYISHFASEEQAILFLDGICLLLISLLFILRIGELMKGGIQRANGRKKSKRQKQLLKTRAIEYTLPDRDNTYVRARLNTSLNPEKESDITPMEVRLEYVRKMLARVKEASLSPVERLDIEELSSLVALYEAKEGWSTEDRKTLNEIFARLLKLSAKYEIAV